MPIYAYRCDACGHTKDVLQKLSDSPLECCPACGASEFRKQLTAAGFQLKGSGWYVTDFKGGAAPAAKSEDAKSDAAKPAADAAPASDAKPAGDAAKPVDAKPAAHTKQSAPPPATSAKGSASGTAAPPAPAAGSGRE